MQISGRFSLQCKERKKRGIESESGASEEMKEEREREKKHYLFFMLPWDFTESHKAFFGYFTLKKKKKKKRADKGAIMLLEKGDTDLRNIVPNNTYGRVCLSAQQLQCS